MQYFDFSYKWQLKTGYPKKKNGYFVFSCFACGGGSTMGYKLAGYDVLGFNEIDPKMAECYIENHNPKYQFIEPIQEFKNRNDLPKELFNLDILDGSPPCSNFSMAGNREKDWGKKKKFREGQQEQVLDILFFDFIDLTKKLQPKIVISENVPGILMGTAFQYVQKIYKDFKNAGYYTIHRLLDASKMGVPQKRKRVFFFSIRKDLIKHIDTYDFFDENPKIDLMFNEKGILFKEIKTNSKRKTIQKTIQDAYHYCTINKNSDFAQYFEKISGKRKYFNTRLIFNNEICSTIKSDCTHIIEGEKAYINNEEIKKASTFPNDYNFKKNKVDYLCGMSVPPVMMAQISKQIEIQWLDKIYQK